MGVNIGRGFNAISGQISKGFSNITSRITKGFSNLGKGNNIFSRISNGVKNLYTKAKTNFGNTFGKKASAGKVEVFGQGYGTDGPMLMNVEDAAKLVSDGKISAGELGKQFAGDKSGFFTKQLTKAQIDSQNIIRNTLNDAYKETLNGYDSNALKFFNDVKTRAVTEGTYLDDYQIGNLINNNGATTSIGYGNVTPDGISDRFVKTTFDIDKSNNYKFVPGSGGEKGFYEFTGNDMFKTPKGTSTISKTTKKLKDVAFAKADSLLGNYRDLDEIPAPYMIGPNQDMTMQTSTTGFGGTNIEGSQGGNFIAAVYGDENANAVRNYYKKMNILGDYA